VALPTLGRQRPGLARGRKIPLFWLPLGAVSVAAVLYVTYRTGSTRHGWALSQCAEAGRVCGTKMAWFYALEAIPLAVPCLLLRNRRIGAACAVALLVLPQLYFGPSNDLEMRGSLPAILVSTFGLCSFIERRAQRYWAAPAVLLLLVQSYGALSEVARAVVDFEQRPWRASGLGATCREHFPGSLVDGYSPHYMIPFDDARSGALGGVLRGCRGGDGSFGAFPQLRDP
jgi:hypothetical protein